MDLCQLLPHVFKLCPQVSALVAMSLTFAQVCALATLSVMMLSVMIYGDDVGKEHCYSSCSQVDGHQSPCTGRAPLYACVPQSPCLHRHAQDSRRASARRPPASEGAIAAGPASRPARAGPSQARRRSELVEGDDVDGLDVLGLAVAHELLLDDRVHRLHLGVLDHGRDLHLLNAVPDRHQLGCGAVRGDALRQAPIGGKGGLTDVSRQRVGVKGTWTGIATKSAHEQMQTGCEAVDSSGPL